MWMIIITVMVDSLVRDLWVERETYVAVERGSGLVMYVRVFCGREIEERLRVMTVRGGGW